jgi:hypothetical protein
LLEFHHLPTLPCMLIYPIRRHRAQLFLECTTNTAG